LFEHDYIFKTVYDLDGYIPLQGESYLPNSWN